MKPKTILILILLLIALGSLKISSNKANSQSICDNVTLTVFPNPAYVGDKIHFWVTLPLMSPPLSWTDDNTLPTGVENCVGEGRSTSSGYITYKQVCTAKTPGNQVWAVKVSYCQNSSCTITSECFQSALYTIKELTPPTPLPTSNSPDAYNLKGKIINSGGYKNLIVWFKWREKDSNYWNFTIPKNIFVRSLPQSFSYRLSGLEPCKTYQYKVVAMNPNGIAESSNIGEFKTACPTFSIKCSANPYFAETNKTITFTAYSTLNQITSYYWYGACKGTASTCQITPSQPGVYTTYLTVRYTENNKTKSLTTKCSAYVFSTASPTVNIE